MSVKSRSECEGKHRQRAEVREREKEVKLPQLSATKQKS